ncbi:MAG: glucosyltransferase domain-containing protein [Lachnospiraceae bacterium]|nr:glucosyltransferase domain-containing protein [Lachnospiraceae bacterium]
MIGTAFSAVFFSLHKMAFTTNIGIDTEWFILGNYGKEWMIKTLGRFGMYCSTMLLDHAGFSPYANGAIFLIGFTLSALLWIRFFTLINGEIRPEYLIFILAYVMHPLWIYQFYFLLQTAEISIALCLQAVSFILLYRVIEGTCSKAGRIACAVLSVLSAVYAIATYQAFMELHITVAVAFAILMYDSSVRIDENRPSYFRELLFIAGHFAASAGLYTVICKVAGWGKNDYLAVVWGSKGVIEIVRDLIRDAAHLLLGKEEYAGYIVLLGMLLSAFCCIWSFIRRKKKDDMCRFILLICLCASCYALSVVMGRPADPRTRFSVIFVTAFIGMYSVERFNDSFATQDPLTVRNPILSVKVAIYGIVAISLLMQLGKMQRLIYTNDICNAQQYEVASDIARNIDLAGADENSRILIVGHWDAPLNNACHRSDIVGHSSFEWGYDENDPVSATYRSGLYINAACGTRYGFELYGDNYEQDVQTAILMTSQMPSYPGDGYVCKNGDLIVVKLSEPGE